jgi:hypothetical protein
MNSSFCIQQKLKIVGNYFVQLGTFPQLLNFKVQTSCNSSKEGACFLVLALIFLTQEPNYSRSYPHISQLSGFPHCVPKRHLHEELRRFELLGLLSFCHVEHMRSPSLPSLPLNSSTTVHKEFFSKEKKDVNGVY